MHTFLRSNGRIVKLIAEHPTLFSDVPQQTTVLTHDIDVGTAVPIKQHPYRVNPKKREVMRMEVEYLLQHGLAEPSKSPWSFPLLAGAKVRFFIAVLYGLPEGK